MDSFNENLDSFNESLNENKESAKKSANVGSDFLGRLIMSTNREVQNLPWYLDYSWQVYRAVFLTIIFILFFVFKGIERYLVKSEFDDYLVKVYNLVSFFILINITIYFFMVTYNRYRSTIKGKKGSKGPRGKRGLQGFNSNCDICTPKTNVMKKMYKKPLKKEIVKNEDVVVDMSNPPDKGWRVLDSQTYKDEYKSNPSDYVDVMKNTYIGVDCIGNNCTKLPSNDFYKEQRKIKLERRDETGFLPSIEVTEQRPIIGVAANVNNNKIETLQYFVDDNPKHSKKRYTPKLLGSRFGNLTNNGKKTNFVCPNNSAIYKVDSMSDSKGIVGLKFHCQDVNTGKEVLVQDENNYKSYGYTFGKNPRQDNKNYYFKSVQCEPLQTKGESGKENEVSQFYPTFISEVSGSDNGKIVKNLRFNKCSYYKK